MGVDLLVFAVLMACLAAGVVVLCVISEASEAWQITQHGWTSGHRRHR